jgi:hypothetical protein
MGRGDGPVQREILSVLRSAPPWMPLDPGWELVDADGVPTWAAADGFDPSAPTMTLADLHRAMLGPRPSWGDAYNLSRAIAGLERRKRVRVLWVAGNRLMRWVNGRRRWRERPPRRERIVQYQPIIRPPGG